MYGSFNPTALVLIDVQKGFGDPYWGRRNNPLAEKQMGRLLQSWRDEGWPVVHIRHLSTEPQSPLQPGLPGCEWQDFARPLPSEAVFEKSVNCGFIGTGLEDWFRQHKIDTLVVVGLTTNHCVSSTVRTAGNLGFRVFLVADGTATFDRRDHRGRLIPAEEVHRISLANLHREFATVVMTDTLLPPNRG